jgi:ATP-binding protein involved in chromosome partitioning
MMTVTVDNVLDALRHVNHPSTATDIVSTNLVQNIVVEGNSISFELVFNKMNDPLANSIKKACKKAIEGMIGKEYEVVISEKFPAKSYSSEYQSLNKVKNIIAIASGKGGVGKSTVAVNLAVAASHLGAKVALLDADIYGPSIPKMFGAENYKPVIEEIEGREQIIPLDKYDIRIQSIGFFVNQSEAMIWRGPMASNALKQIISQTYWGELDYLFIDLPPGTGDIHLTIVQELPLTGVIVVSTPQKVALADVLKGINMFRSEKINVPVIGLVENMSWFTPQELPDNKYYLFGKDGCKALAKELNIPLLGQIPIVQSICDNSDNGNPVALNPFTLEGKSFASLAENALSEIDKRNASLPPTQRVQMKQ